MGTIHSVRNHVVATGFVGLHFYSCHVVSIENDLDGFQITYASMGRDVRSGIATGSVISSSPERPSGPADDSTAFPLRGPAIRLCKQLTSLSAIGSSRIPQRLPYKLSYSGVSWAGVFFVRHCTARGLIKTNHPHVSCMGL